MHNIFLSEPQQEFLYTFELVGENNEADSALILKVGREIIDVLKQEGYTICAPVYTGQKGGFLVEVITTVQQIANMLWNHHEAIAEGLADLSGLATIFSAILPTLKKMLGIYEKQVGKEASITHPIKITVEIDGVSLNIESKDLTQAEAALQLALRYRSINTATIDQVTSKSKVKIQGRIPARKRKRRR